MRKYFSFLLALTMILSLGATAYATEDGDGTGDYYGEVTGSYVPGTETSATVFSVDVQWLNLSFTYYAEKAPEWDPANHVYTAPAPAHWEGEGSIVITNHSNAKITAEPKYTSTEGYADAYVTFSTAKLSLPSAESGTAQTGTITVTPGGFLPVMEEADIIGLITLTVTQDPNVTVEETEALISKAAVLAEQMEQSDREDLRDPASTLQTAVAGTRTAVDSYKNGENTQQDLNVSYSELLDTYNWCLGLMNQ